VGSGAQINIKIISNVLNTKNIVLLLLRISGAANLVGYTHWAVISTKILAQLKLNLVHFSRKIWHLVTVDELYRAINAQKLNVIRPNIVNILILITIVSKTSLCPKEQLERVGLQTKNSRQILLGCSL